jgi:hypothetical protein
LEVHSNTGNDVKISEIYEFSTPIASTISFRSLSIDDLSSLLPSFYLGLDFDARQARFGGAVSDDSIIRHCRELASNQAVVLGCIGPTGPITAIELLPLSSTWEDAELALAENARIDRIMILGHLLQLAALLRGSGAAIHLSFG